MTGKVLGAQSSTIQANYLEENYSDADIKLYPTQEEVNLDLVSGRIDALLVDKLVATDWLKTDDGKCCAMSAATSVAGDPSAPPFARRIRTSRR